MTELVLPTPYDLAKSYPHLRFLAFQGHGFHGRGHNQVTLFKTFSNAERYAVNGVSGFSRNSDAAVLLFRVGDLLPVRNGKEGAMFAKRPLVGRVDGEDENQVATRMVESWLEYRESVR